MTSRHPEFRKMSKESALADDTAIESRSSYASAEVASRYYRLMTHEAARAVYCILSEDELGEVTDE
jgi:hypothetical protein